MQISISEDLVFSSGCNCNLHTETLYMDDLLVLEDVELRRFRQRTFYLTHRNQLIYKLLKENNNGNVIDEIVIEKTFNKIYEKLLSVCDGKIVRQKNYRIGYEIKKFDTLKNMKYYIISALKETSIDYYDKNNIRYMTNSVRKVINFDNQCKIALPNVWCV